MGCRIEYRILSSLKVKEGSTCLQHRVLLQWGLTEQPASTATHLSALYRADGILSALFVNFIKTTNSGFCSGRTQHLAPPAQSPQRCRQFYCISSIVDDLDRIKMTKKTLFIVSFFSSSLFIGLQSFCQSTLIASIFFKPNSFSIDKKYEKTLNQIASQLQSDTFGYLRIYAFADTKGSETYNDILSEKRADAVYNYLDSRAKIDTAHVYVAWIGESADIYDLHFPAAHKQKRCVDIFIQFYKKPK